MEALLLLIMGASNIACLVIGAKIGQKVAKDEPIELPKVNPMEKIQEHRERKEAQKQQEWKEAVLRNIEAYDGTANGQKDVPRG
jgi:hypothetical protein